MGNVTERFFDSKDSMTQTLANLLETKLTEGIEKDGQAVLMVSGGSSPAPAYKYLANLEFPWHKVSIAMVDERWVDLAHEKSNEAFIKSTLLQGHAAAAHFVPMKNTSSSAVEGQVECDRTYSVLKNADITILGMGPDGHTASLFPHADGLQNGLETEQHVCAINAIESDVTGSITERMSLTLSRIASSREVVLLISGEEKRAVYEAAKEEGSVYDVPLRAILNHSSIYLTVFWCP